MVRAVVPNLFFHLPALWQPSSCNSTLHISKMFIINIVSVISNLSFLTLLTYVPFPAIIQCFFAAPRCPGLYPWGLRVPEVGNHCFRVMWGRWGGVQFNDAVYLVEL